MLGLTLKLVTDLESMLYRRGLNFFYFNTARLGLAKNMKKGKIFESNIRWTQLCIYFNTIHRQGFISAAFLLR